METNTMTMPARDIARKEGDHVLIDLHLDARLTAKHAPHPRQKEKGVQKKKLKPLVESLFPGKTYTIGSHNTNDDGDVEVCFPGDLGLFGCVYEAWKNHWILRTRPEDWWFPVALHIARAVKEATMEGASGRIGYPGGNEKVRELFREYPGKIDLSVSLDTDTLRDVHYKELFNTLSAKIKETIQVPEYAHLLQNDFGTSGQPEMLASRINLLASMQSVSVYTCYHHHACGLRGLEMRGTVEDWERLQLKLTGLREILQTVQGETGLCDNWWNHVAYVFQYLAKTRRNPNDPSLPKFWINILRDTTDQDWIGGSGGMALCHGEGEAKAYDGWLIRFLTGKDRLMPKYIQRVDCNLSGWNQVPMQINMLASDTTSATMSEEATVIAGIMGFIVHNYEGDEQDRASICLRLFSVLNSCNRSVAVETTEMVPSVEPYHMWAMLLPTDSSLQD